MKKFIGLVVCGTALIFGLRAFAWNGVSINEKVMKSFKETFPLAEKVNWQEFSDRYSVHFEEGSIRTVVDYDKDGNYLSSRRYYTEEYLPVNIICKLRKRYSDKKVFGVTEIATESNTDYYIKMEDAVNWTTVKSDINGVMEIVEKYKKQE
jgi:hypothetical protein